MTKERRAGAILLASVVWECPGLRVPKSSMMARFPTLKTESRWLNSCAGMILKVLTSTGAQIERAPTPRMEDQPCKME